MFRSSMFSGASKGSLLRMTKAAFLCWLFGFSLGCKDKAESPKLTVATLAAYKMENIDVRDCSAEEAVSRWISQCDPSWQMKTRVILVPYPERGAGRKIDQHMINVPSLEALRAILTSAGWTMEMRVLESGEFNSIVIYEWHKEFANV